MVTWEEVADGLASFAAEERFTGSVLVTHGNDTLLEFCAESTRQPTTPPSSSRPR